MFIYALQYLVVEEADGLVVEQRVHRLAGRLVVQVVHGLADLRPETVTW